MESMWIYSLTSNKCNWCICHVDFTCYAHKIEQNAGFRGSAKVWRREKVPLWEEQKNRTVEPSKSQAILLIVYIVIGTIKYFYFDYAPISMQAAYFQAATFIECWELMIGTGKIATKFNNPFTFFHVLDFFSPVSEIETGTSLNNFHFDFWLCNFEFGIYFAYFPIYMYDSGAHTHTNFVDNWYHLNVCKFVDKFRRFQSCHFGRTMQMMLIYMKRKSLNWPTNVTVRYCYRCRSFHFKQTHEKWSIHMKWNTMLWGIFYICINI